MKDRALRNWLLARPNPFRSHLEGYAQEAGRLWALKSITRGEPKEIRLMAFERADSAYERLKRHIVTELDANKIDYHVDQLFMVSIELAEKFYPGGTG